MIEGVWSERAFQYKKIFGDESGLMQHVHDRHEVKISAQICILSTKTSRQKQDINIL